MISGKIFIGFEPANPHIFSVKIFALSLKISTNEAKTEKWKDGVNNFLLDCHFLPLLKIRDKLKHSIKAFFFASNITQLASSIILIIALNHAWLLINLLVEYPVYGRYSLCERYQFCERKISLGLFH